MVFLPTGSTQIPHVHGFLGTFLGIALDRPAAPPNASPETPPIHKGLHAQKSNSAGQVVPVACGRWSVLESANERLPALAAQISVLLKGESIGEGENNTPHTTIGGGAIMVSTARGLAQFLSAGNAHSASRRSALCSSKTCSPSVLPSQSPELSRKRHQFPRRLFLLPCRPERDDVG